MIDPAPTANAARESIAHRRRMAFARLIKRSLLRRTGSVLSVTRVTSTGVRLGLVSGGGR